MGRPQVAEGAYLISSRGQPTSGGNPAWGFDVGLTTPHRKNKLVKKDHKKPRTEDGMGCAGHVALTG
jgi:hypothetical protein